MLTIRHFEIFHTVAETGNFTKAAQKLFITQSAVSHTIRELEDYTGSRLFDRLSKSVRLTSAGKLLLAETSPLLVSYEALDRKIRHLEEEAPIHLVSSITAASFWLPRALKRFRKDWPEVPVYVDVVSAAESVQRLRDGTADFALTEGLKPSEPFLSYRFSSYCLKIVCAPDYPAAGRIFLPAELGREHLLLREKGSAIRDTFDSALLLLGQTVTPFWTSVNSSALIQAAKAGLGITVLPEVLVEKDLEERQLVSLQVREFHLQNELFVVHHREKHLSPALLSLLSYIRAAS